MNTSRSSNASCDTTLKALQLQFFTWAGCWVKARDKMEQHPIDIPDLVQLLQALGFSIRRMDGCHPQETTELKDGKKGVRVVIMCNHSGNRCYLEQPLNDSKCTCVKMFSDDSRDSFWELTETKPFSNQATSLVETGSALIPPLSKELQHVVYSVVNYLIHMIHGHREEKNISVATGEPTTKEDNPIRHSDQSYSIQQPTQRIKGSTSVSDCGKNPIIHVYSPYKGTSSQTRYRSLDTLTAPGEGVAFPEPGKLISEYETTAILNSLKHLSVNDFDEDNKSNKSSIGESRVSRKALTLIKGAVKDLLNAISLIETENLDVSADSVFGTPLNKTTSKTKNARSLKPLSSLLHRSVSSPSLSKPKGSVGKLLRVVGQSASSASVKTGAIPKKLESSKRCSSVSVLGDNKSKITKALPKKPIRSKKEEEKKVIKKN